jgi:hypothetical protein
LHGCDKTIKQNVTVKRYHIDGNITVGMYLNISYKYEQIPNIAGSRSIFKSFNFNKPPQQLKPTANLPVLFD